MSLFVIADIRSSRLRETIEKLAGEIVELELNLSEADLMLKAIVSERDELRKRLSELDGGA